jgi:hypothetical protein
MRRGIAVSWHALSFLLAAVLYFLFLLPRWWELMGDVSHGLGTGLRIATGALIGLTALPVVFNLLRSRKPEYGTPQLALTMRIWSIVGHVLAGVLIIGAAVAEFWLSLDSAGQWLFGIYGAAAAIAALAAAAFYLAFVAELPPPPPKPLKSKPAKKQAEPEESDDEVLETTGEPVADETVDEETVTDEPAEVTATEDTADQDDADKDSADKDAVPAATGGRLRNRRPSGKTGGSSTTRRRGSGGVAVSDD